MNIFVSYSSLNRAIVNELVSDLTDMEHEIWYDQELEGGQKWWDNILENIRQCDLLVFALTPQSLDSYPCQLEYGYANALRKHIIPVLLVEGVNYNLLPVVLQERQIIDYIQRDKQAYKKLDAAISKLPPPLALPDPLPTAPPLPISPLASLKSDIDSPVLSYEQQVAILHQLKSFLHNSDYSRDARHLLERLSQHPTLLASVLREIEAALAGPVPPAPAPPTEWPELPTAPPQATTAQPSTIEPTAEEKPSFVPPPIELHEGEEILHEVDVSFSAGATLGMASGLFTSGVTTAATVAARLASSRKMTITNQRLVFSPNLTNKEQEDIPLGAITEVKKVVKLLDPSIQVRTKSGKDYTFSLIAAMGVGYGNREMIIALIKSHIPK